MIKILHIADVHLGYSYRTKKKTLRDILDGCIEKSMEKAVDFSIENEIDLFLIAGDLFDFGPIGPKTYDFFMRMVRKLRDNSIEVAYGLGNHDNLTLMQEGVIKSFKEQMIVFDKSWVESVYLKTRKGESYYLHGIGHEYDKMDENLIKNFPPANKEADYNIGLAHCFVESALSSGDYDKYLPTTYEDLLSKKYDYFALGHIHLPSVYKDTNVAYSGSLQALSFKEEGKRGANYIEIDKYGTKIKHMDFSINHYKTIELEMAGEDLDHLQIISYLSKKISLEASEYNLKNTLIRLILKGSIPPSSLRILENEVEYIGEQIQINTSCLYISIELDQLSMAFEHKNIYGQDHFLSYALKNFQEEIYEIKSNLIDNMNKNGIDTKDIDLEEYVEAIKKDMIESFIKR